MKKKHRRAVYYFLHKIYYLPNYITTLAINQRN